MIAVRFPPALSRNIKGTISQVPCFFDILQIDDIGASDIDTLKIIKDACFNILRDMKYANIINLMLSEIGGGYAYFHFQIPLKSIDQDSMVPDETPISYYGIIEYFRLDKSDLNTIN